jgi:hypothetical protein
LGGSSGYTTWVCAWWVRKTIRFGQKRSPNCDFSVLPRSFHPIHFQKHMTGGSGVRGKANLILSEKSFQLSSLLIVDRDGKGYKGSAEVARTSQKIGLSNPDGSVFIDARARV